MTVDRSDSPRGVDWRAPAGKGSTLFGAGATVAERFLASAVGVAAALVLTGVVFFQSSEWNVVQYVVGAVIAFDVCAGVVANGLNSAKRDHFGPPSATLRAAGGRIVRMPIVFTALHVHPLVVALLYTPPQWWWGVGWYVYLIASVTAVRLSPLYLERPVALAACAVAAMGGAFIPSPTFWAWLPLMLALKLVLAHAVQEEPYRPGASKRLSH